MYRIKFLRKNRLNLVDWIFLFCSNSWSKVFQNVAASENAMQIVLCSTKNQWPL